MVKNVISFGPKVVSKLKGFWKLMNAQNLWLPLATFILSTFIISNCNQLKVAKVVQVPSNQWVYLKDTSSSESINFINAENESRFLKQRLGLSWLNPDDYIEFKDKRFKMSSNLDSLWFDYSTKFPNFD